MIFAVEIPSTVNTSHSKFQMVLLLVFSFSFFAQIYQCSTCVSCKLCKKICIYFVYATDCRLIKSKLNACSSFQYKDNFAINHPSTERFSTNLNSLRMIYNLNDLYITSLLVKLDGCSGLMLLFLYYTVFCSCGLVREMEVKGSFFEVLNVCNFAI